MYLTRLLYDGVGPLNKINLSMEFTAEGLPKPLVFVGKNGSGKSILLSNIVDFMYEFATKGFKNVTKGDSISHDYYKIIASNQIGLHKEYMVSYISAQEDNSEFGFYVKSGNVDVVNYGNLNGIKVRSYGKVEDNYKQLFNNGDILVENSDESIIRKIFGENVFCYFGDNRYSYPDWLGKKYDLDNHIGEKRLFGNILPVSIVGTNCVETIKEWLFDVVVDAKPQIYARHSAAGVNYELDDSQADILKCLRIRDNIDKILSVVLDRDVQFVFGRRNRYADRLFIIDKATKHEVVHSFNGLSTGQQILFSLFAHIVRFADAYSLGNSVNLDQIKGIVVIDEVELHMHPSLVSNAISRLMKIFPRVQFIVTSHSPLFVLSLEKEYGRNGFNLYELPQGDKISAENFSEFGITFEKYCNTGTARKLMQKKIDMALLDLLNIKPLVVTEGKTDWKHMKAAFVELKNKGDHKELLDDLDFEFLEYDNLKMGGSEIKRMCETYSKVPHTRKIIFIADRDTQQDIKVLTYEGGVKDWGNNVYSFCIPRVPYRGEEICIEHYYSDEEIMTKDDKGRRLYIGKEFDEHGRGFNTAEGKLYSGGSRRDILGTSKIIDGDENNRVVSIDVLSDNANYALSKENFAKNVLNRVSGFDQFNFEPFIWIFEILRKIVK